MGHTGAVQASYSSVAYFRPRSQLLCYASVALVYIVISLLTGARFMGDTVYYVDSIQAHQAGRDVLFWDFGHLLWRPLGSVLARALGPVTARLVGSDARAAVTLLLIATSWCAGLLSLLLVYGLMCKLCQSRRIAALATIGFLFTETFLNYKQAGVAYIPGLCLLLLAVFLVCRAERQEANLGVAGLAGTILAASIGLWFPYVLSAPAVLSCPILLSRSKRGWRVALYAFAGFCIAGGGMYLAVLAHLHIYRLSEILKWVQHSSHGIGGISGLSRMVFGFARSFIDMGNDGTLLKRYFLRDPFNPVSLFELLGVTLWKLVIFYAVLAIALLRLLWSVYDRRIFALLAINALPVLGFGVLWQGGDMERYLPLYPVLFVSVSCALCNARPVFRALALTLLATIVITNTTALSRTRLESSRRQSIARIHDFEPRLKPQSLVAVTHSQDNLVNFGRSFLFDPLNRTGDLYVYAVLQLGSDQVPRWREEFARFALHAWAQHGDVWISKRMLHPHPEAAWDWVEGDDRRVSWSDLYGFFSRFETASLSGETDSFVLLLPSSKNFALLLELENKKQVHP